MLLLVTGASGVGKSTVRRILQSQVAPEVECAELADISPLSVVRNLRWRQRTVEMCAKSALRLHREGRHLRLCGAPVGAVEVVAAPSAGELDGVAFCLLDAAPGAQAVRLAARGDDPALLIHHQAFADWMREQAADPLCRLDVVATNGWEEMRWDRVLDVATDWAVHVIDTTELPPQDTAAAVFTWALHPRSATSPAIPKPARFLKGLLVAAPAFTAAAWRGSPRPNSSPAVWRRKGRADSTDLPSGRPRNSRARQRDAERAPAPRSRSRRRNATSGIRGRPSAPGRPSARGRQGVPRGWRSPRPGRRPNAASTHGARGSRQRPRSTGADPPRRGRRSGRRDAGSHRSSGRDGRSTAQGRHRRTPR